MTTTTPPAPSYRVGRIVPSSNTTMETEIPDLLRGRAEVAREQFTFHSARMRMQEVNAGELRLMDDAQGQAEGRCTISRRAEDAMRAGTVIRVRRIVAVVAFAKDDPVIVATARVRLKAIVASTSHAPLAAKRLEGR